MSAKLSLMSLSRVIASVMIAAVMEPEVQPSYKLAASGALDFPADTVRFYILRICYEVLFLC